MTTTMQCRNLVSREKESLQHILKCDADFSEDNIDSVRLWKFPFLDNAITVSILCTHEYPVSFPALVTVHRSSCKTNIRHILTVDRNWQKRLCAENTCCQDLLEIQRFLQNVAHQLKGAPSVIAILLAARKHVIGDGDTAYVYNDFFEKRSERIGEEGKSTHVMASNPLAYVKCTAEAFHEWQEKFAAETTVPATKSATTFNHRNACTGRAFFEINVDVREVDWGLFGEGEDTIAA